jgi:hypothetical protein
LLAALPRIDIKNIEPRRRPGRHADERAGMAIPQLLDLLGVDYRIAEPMRASRFL